MKIFIAGPRAITRLDSLVTARLASIADKNYTVLVGDANGADKAIQKYYANINYANVIVYASNGKARNNIANWPVEAVLVSSTVKGFEFYAKKDAAMATAADYGFMLWNKESKGTLNNILNLLSYNKKTLVYLNPDKEFINIDSRNALETLLLSCPCETMALYKQLLGDNAEA